MGKTGTTKTVEGAASAKRTGRGLVREYAVPVGIAIAAGILGGTIAVKVVGLTVAMGVAAGIVAAVTTYQKVGEVLVKVRT